MSENETGLQQRTEDSGGRWGREPYEPEDLKEEYGTTDSGRLEVRCPKCFKEWYPVATCCVKRGSRTADPFCPKCGTDFRLSTLDMEPEWPVGVGAVLYEDRPDTPENERRLHHVVARLEDVDSGEKYLRIQDGTHTVEYHYHVDDVLADFAPAGWQFPPSRKPTYHLTRSCGVDDEMDLMTGPEP